MTQNERNGAALPTTMKAQVIDHFGGPEVFHEMQLPVPTLQPGYVLVQVHATSVNSMDIKFR